MSAHSFRPDLQPEPHSAQIHAGQTAHEHLLDVELSVGVAARPRGDGQSLLDHDGGSPRRRGRPTRRRNGARRSSFRASRERWSCSTAPRSAFQKIAGETTGHPVAVFQRIDQAGYKLPIDERILADTDTLMVFGLDHILSEQEAAPEEIAAIREWLKREGTCLLLAPHHDVGFTERHEAAPDGISAPRRPARAAPAAVRPIHALADEGAWTFRCTTPTAFGPRS